MRPIAVEEIKAADWVRDYSENAHIIAFGKRKPAEWDRIDYALLLVQENSMPVGYITCRELDHETVYWQFGGAMPDARGSLTANSAFLAALEHAHGRYKRVTFVVENTNKAMLKMALYHDFRIVGTRSFHGTVLVEHMLEFSEEVPHVTE